MTLLATSTRLSLFSSKFSKTTIIVTYIIRKMWGDSAPSIFQIFEHNLYSLQLKELKQAKSTYKQ